MNVHGGSRLGHYEILDLIGEGGMGTVYLASDSQLGRQVAVKIVRAPFADDPDRMSRFAREARLLASLSHPNIATIHGFEEVDGLSFLVLELVPGVTLGERLSRGRLAMREALSLAAQLAGAIEAAHAAGVIHRDLKPANIKITPDGRLKVLDFGLAKALARDSDAPVSRDAATLSGTGAGMILGTPAYMSPEQARGEVVDKRADIWAFGCVLYDMLTGRAAFGCDTRSDTIAAVLTRDPDWSLLPDRTPAPIRCLVRRALEKDPQRRLRDAGDARLEIEDALSALADGSGTSVAERPRIPPPPRRRRVLAAAAVMLAVLSASAAWLLKPSPSPPAANAVRFAVPIPTGEHLDGLDYNAVALSPAGTHVAFIASRGGPSRLFVRALSAFDARPIEDTEGALEPFFSPDGEWIAFFADGKLKKVRTAGGPTLTICDAAIGFGAAWDATGTIVYAPGSGTALSQVPAEGGVPRPLTTLDAARREFSHRWPELIPGAGAVLYSVGTEGTWDDAEIVVQWLKTGKRQSVLKGGTNPRYVAATGWLLYAHAGSIFGVGFDPASGRTTGSPVELLTGVLESSDGAMQLGVSRSGGVAYVTGDEQGTGRSLVWMDRQGNVQPLAAPPRAYASPRLSPDGRQVAVAIGGTDRDEVWTYDIAGNRLTQMTFEGGASPVWSSDGSHVIFAAVRGGAPALFWKRVDGQGPDERLSSTGRSEIPNSASRDGRTVAVVEYDAATGRHVQLLSIDDRTTRPLSTGAANTKAGAFSPDGEWIAYVSDQSGRDQVYIAAVKDPSRRTMVSTDGGSEPVWRPDGLELFFRAGNRVMAAPVATHPTLAVKPARTLFEGAFEAGAAGRPAFDVTADGARFLMVARRESERPQHELRVALGALAKPGATGASPGLSSGAFGR